MGKVLLANQKSVHFVGELEGYQPCYQEKGFEGYEETHEEVNYIANQGGYQFKNFNTNYNHLNLFYRSTNVKKPTRSSVPSTTKATKIKLPT